MAKVQNVWTVQDGEVRKPGAIHIALFALVVGVGAVAGSFGNLVIPLGYGVAGFWPGVAVQAVASIWFGMWGAFAGGVFPFVSNSLTGAPLYVSVAYFPANFLQGLIPRFAFKFWKLDPRLKSAKDYMGYILFGAIINNLVGATWAVTALRAFGLITVQSVPLFFTGWMGGNGLASLIFGIILLKALSPLVVRSRAFCKKWWS